MGQSQRGVRFTRGHVFESTEGLKIDPIQIDKDTVDSDNSPTTRLRSGLVLQEQTGGKFSHIGAASPKSAAVASVVSLIAVVAQLASGTVTVRDSEGNVVNVAVAADDDTLAEVLDVLNTNTKFADLFVAADDGSGKLKISALNELSSIEVSSTVDAVFGAGGATGVPTIPKFRVLIDPVYSMLEGLSESVEDQDKAGAFGGGIIKRDNLIGSNMQAEAYFRRNGMIII